MRVLIINTSERTGGAAIAASRLMEALKNSGIKAKMLVRDKQTDQVTVVALKKSWRQIWQFVWERIVIWIANRFKKHNLFAVDIRKIFLSGKPVVWTMHDMWPVTGICHHAGDCTHYQAQCHDCPLLYRGHRHDLSYKTFVKKQQLYKDANITFVACSRWLEELAKKSALTLGHTVTNLPNPINTNLFHPTDKVAARRKLNLPEDKRLLLFSSMKITDKKKGIDYLVEACRLLHEKQPGFCEKLAVVVVGKESQQYADLFPFPVYCLSYIGKEKEMTAVYNAVDLFVTPSLQENLPNTIMEAMSCGVPCVGFCIGGIPEMIDHLHNGYVARYRSAEDLANGICWSLTEGDYQSLSTEARRKVLSTYTEHVVAMKYIGIYNHITGQNA